MPRNKLKGVKLRLSLWPIFLLITIVAFFVFNIQVEWSHFDAVGSIIFYLFCGLTVMFFLIESQDRD